MEREQRFCPNPFCPTESWLVQPSQVVRDVWVVIARLGDISYTIISHDPVCPDCGAALCPAVELGRSASGGLIESGPMLDYVCSLR